MISKNSSKGGIKITNQNLTSYDPAIQQSNFNAKMLDEYDAECELDLENWEIDDYRLLTNWENVEHNGWNLPGTREENYWCGIWKTKGCVHVKDHNLPEHQGKAFIKRFQNFCYRSVCRKCYEKWLARAANAATKRIEKFAQDNKIKPIHVVVSISGWDIELDFKEMKKKARTILKQIGIIGGVLIFHPFRFNKKIRCFYYSPHFHCVGFGEIPKNKIVTTYYENGWFIKYLGPRKSVFSTFYYLLSHCGIRKGFHSVSWFGELSYRKVRKEKEQNNNKCPSCGRKLVELYYEGEFSGIPDEQPFEGYLDPEGWHPVNSVDEIESDPYKFEFDSRKKINEILKSLTLAN